MVVVWILSLILRIYLFTFGLLSGGCQAESSYFLRNHTVLPESNYFPRAVMWKRNYLTTPESNYLSGVTTQKVIITFL